MYPYVIDLGQVDLPFLGETHLFLPSYGVLFATAVLIAWWWFLRRTRSLGIPEETGFNLAFYSLIAGILGAKVLLIVVERDIPGSVQEWIGLLRSAGVLAGGVIAGIATFVLYGRAQGLPVLKLGDAIAAPLALAQSVGRMGCLFAGCCYGKPAGPDSWLSMVFHSTAAHDQTGVPLGIPLRPTQAMQMLSDLLLAVLLTWLWRRKVRPDGTVFWIYLLAYGIGRGLIEFWRGDLQRGVYLGGSISTSQLISLAGIAFATVMLVTGWLRRRATEEA